MKNWLNRYFQLDENNTSIGKEVMAGLTTFFAMSYIIFVNPNLLAQTGIPYQGAFLATVISAGLATLFMGLYANVPYALAPGMGLNAFFTYTVCFSLGFTWQEGLSMVFICGIINFIITVTNLRKKILLAIPEQLQYAISAGIGIFIAYVGLKNADLLQFTSSPDNIISINGGDPAATNFPGGVQSVVSGGGTLVEICNFKNPMTLLALAGLVITVVLLIRNVNGAILIGIVATTIIGILTGVVDLSSINFGQASLGESFRQLGMTFGVIFTRQGIPALFSDVSRLPLVVMTIFSMCLSDLFDTIGTFVGTGRKSGIFSDEDVQALESDAPGKTKMEKAMYADSLGTIIGSVVGTTNTTTFVESAAGIGEGGRTGLTSVVTAICFFISIFLSPVIQIVPSAATAPALIIVGIMMLSSLNDIHWEDLSVAIPCFFASVFMGLCYSISYGIAAGFIAYVVVKLAQGKPKDINPVIWVASILFILNFIVLAVI